MYKSNKQVSDAAIFIEHDGNCFDIDEMVKLSVQRNVTSCRRIFLASSKLFANMSVAEEKGKVAYYGRLDVSSFGDEFPAGAVMIVKLGDEIVRLIDHDLKQSEKDILFDRISITHTPFGTVAIGVVSGLDGAPEPAAFNVKWKTLATGICTEDTIVVYAAAGTTVIIETTELFLDADLTIPIDDGFIVLVNDHIHVVDSGAVAGDTGQSCIVAPVVCKQITLTKTTGTPSAHYKTCHGVTTDTTINTSTVICTDGHGFTISGGGVTVNSIVDGDCGS